MGDAAKVDGSAAAVRAEYQRKQRDRKRLYRARLKVKHMSLLSLLSTCSNPSTPIAAAVVVAC